MAHQMVDYIADYHASIEKHPVRSAVKPGYLAPLLPTGVTHWQHPSFFAYFASTASYPAAVADMLSGALGVIGFSWIGSPAATELEMVCMDWFGQLLGLPARFLHTASGGRGGGVIQSTASEATLVAMLAARWRCLEGRPLEDSLRLVAYCSDQGHSSIRKATMIAGLPHLRVLPAAAADHYALRAEALEEAADLAAGLLPFFVCATIGTTSSCAVDPVRQIGEVAQRHRLWLHVDSAWAGVFALLPEQRAKHFQGLELADSALTLTPEYLKAQGNDYDFKDMQVPLGRRFRSLKLWFVMRMYGAAGLRSFLESRLRLQRRFDGLLAADARFEVAPGTTPRFGLTCFRLRGATDEQSAALLEAVNATGEAFLVHTVLDGRHTLCMAIGGVRTEDRHVEAAWRLIQGQATRLLQEWGDGLANGTSARD
eukprot:scaffold15.g4322.t1